MYQGAEIDLGSEDGKTHHGRIAHRQLAAQASARVEISHFYLWQGLLRFRQSDRESTERAVPDH
jgi:hypothetical protein